jgi:hypothetical protein
MGAAHKNLALVASNVTTVLQQLMATNLMIMTLVTLLTMANKKLVDALARNKKVALPAVPLLAAALAIGGGHATNTPFPGNYCWTYGHWVSQHHTSVTCRNKAVGHKDNTTCANTMGGGNANKGWTSCN